MEFDIAVIGAGVAGLGVAWRLAGRGERVAVFERDEVGAGASGAAAGMLAPAAEVTFQEEPLLQLGLRSMELYPDFVEELEQASGRDVDYRTEGTLVVGIDRDDTEELSRLHEFHQELGLDVSRLSGDDAREIEPALAPRVHSALHVPGDHQIDAYRMVEALGEAFEEAGGQLYEQTEVSRVDCDGRVHGVELADGTEVTAPTVLLAAGAWTRKLEGIPDDVMPPVRPVRGQMLALAMEPDDICQHVIRAPDAYMSPKSDGSLVVGATSEEMGFDDRLTAGGVFELLRGAWEAMPGIYDLPLLDLWTGFRPVTLDNEPVLGPTKVDGLWLATGHGRNGILLTAVTAIEMARSIASGELTDTLEEFAP